MTGMEDRAGAEPGGTCPAFTQTAASQAAASQGAASQSAASQALDATRAVIRDVAELDRPPDPAAELERDLHLSSFDMIAVCVGLEERLGASTDFGRVARARTVEELSRCWEG